MRTTIHQDFRISLKDTPGKVYDRVDLPYSIEMPFVDQQLWLTKTQMAKIFNTNYRKIEECIRQIIKRLNVSEMDYSSYFLICRWQKETHHKFYRIDLVLLIGKILNTKGYNDFKTWTGIE